MRAVIKNQKSEWCSVKSGVLQGSHVLPVGCSCYEQISQFHRPDNVGLLP